MAATELGGAAAPNKVRPDHVFVSNLPKDCEEETLKVAFAQYSTVKWMRLFKTGTRLAALLQLGSADEAAFVVENLNGAVISDAIPTPITLAYSEGGGGSKKHVSKQIGGGGPSKAALGMSGALRSSPYGSPLVRSLSGTGPPTAGGAAAMRGGKGGQQAGPGSMADFKKGLLNENVLPGGKWANDDGALHIGGLPADTTEQDLYEIFATFGAIPSKGLRAMSNPDGSCTGVAFVNFVDPSCAANAISVLDGRKIGAGTGRVIHVKPKRRQ